MDVLNLTVSRTFLFKLPNEDIQKPYTLAQICVIQAPLSLSANYQREIIKYITQGFVM